MTEDCQQSLNDDDDDCVVIREPVKLTQYDKRRQELRALEEKQARLLAIPEPTPHDRQNLAVLEVQIPNAQKRFEIEAKRGLDDVWRRRRGIDEWRAGEGNEAYNASRRAVREKPNADLSHLSPEEKVQYRKDFRADSNWRKRFQGNGWTPEQIETALVVRIEAREAARGKVRPQQPEPVAMEDLPAFGKF